MSVFNFSKSIISIPNKKVIKESINHEERKTILKYMSKTQAEYIFKLLDIKQLSIQYREFRHLDRNIIEITNIEENGIKINLQFKHFFLSSGSSRVQADTLKGFWLPTSEKIDRQEGLVGTKVVSKAEDTYLNSFEVNTPNNYYKDNSIILSREDLNNNIDIYGRFILPIYAKISLWLHINYTTNNTPSQRYVNSYGNYSTTPSYISPRGQQNAIMREEQRRTNKKYYKEQTNHIIEIKKSKKKNKKKRKKNTKRRKKKK